MDKFVMISAKDVNEMQKAQIAEMERKLDTGEIVNNLLGFIAEKITEQATAFPLCKSIQLDFNDGITNNDLKDKQIDKVIETAVKELKRLDYAVEKSDIRFDNGYWNDRIYRIFW